MAFPRHFGYVAAVMLVAVLTAAFIPSSGVASVTLAAIRSPASLAAESLVGTPTVPVSVTVARSFAVTGSLDPTHTGDVSLACYRRVSGAWVLARSVPASVTTPAAGPQYSAAVSLDAAGTWVVRAETAGTSEAEASVSATSSEIRVSSHSDAIVWNRDGVLTLPERMAYRSDARQMIVATAKSLLSHSGTVAVYEYRSGDWVKLISSPARFGRNGLCAGSVRRRGNGKTPTGIWLMPDYVFGQHASKPSGTKLKYRHITKYHWWSAEKGSHYNTWVWSRRHVDGEHLINYTRTYEYALSSGYNAKPNTSVYGRGTGIFLHVWLGKTTAGCVSVPRETMQRVFRTLDPAKRRVFVVGTIGENDPTRVVIY